MVMFDHQDSLGALNEDIPLREKLECIHGVLKQQYDFIDRISVTVYDAKTDILKTFVDSSGTDEPLQHYQARLADAGSLRDILGHGRPRVVNDLEVFAAGGHIHTQQILKQGYRSSYTLPMFLNGHFFGFVFFNSYRKHPFTPDALHCLDTFGHLISLVITGEMSAIHTLLAALKTAREITHHRDVETAEHLDRMSRYAQLIAKELSGKYDFDDEYIEHIFLFAPLHDIGKIGIPDRILLKPDKLSGREFEQMKGHVQKGRQIIDDMLQNFGLEGFQYVDILRNIAQYHHESIDGSGYPYGLEGGDIPIEARIVAVADVFDALASRRRYKAPWTNDKAFAVLRRLAGSRLDRECVDALERNRAEVERIQDQFREIQAD